jgi:hypothetical protein
MENRRPLQSVCRQRQAGGTESNSHFSSFSLFYEDRVVAGRESLDISCCGAPEPIVIKKFHPKEGAWEGAEQLLTQLVAFALVIKIFLLPPGLFIEYTPNPMFLEREL